MIDISVFLILYMFAYANKSFGITDMGCLHMFKKNNNQKQNKNITLPEDAVFV